MSSPTDRAYEPDDFSFYAPKWGRDPAHSQRPEAVPNISDSNIPEQGDLFSTDEDLAIDRLRVPHSLDPTVLAQPRPRARARSRFGIFVGLAGAASLAAAVTLFMIGKSQRPPSTDASDHGTEAVSFGSRFVEQTTKRLGPSAPQLVVTGSTLRGMDEGSPLGVSIRGVSAGTTLAISGLPPGSALSQGRSSGKSSWRLAAADLPNVMIRPPCGFAGAMNLAVELRLADDTVADRRSVSPAWARRTTCQAPTLAAREETALLLKRGEELIAAGDIAAARLVFQRAAEARDARAALAVAATFDPIVLEKLGVLGLAAEITMARNWYERAKELGSVEAPRRLELLASRDHWALAPNRARRLLPAVTGKAVLPTVAKTGATGCQVPIAILPQASIDQASQH